MPVVRDKITTKRISEAPSGDDGFRIFVESLWPRGISKQKAAIDLWMKDIAPSPEFRKWVNLDAKKCEGFKKRYYSEIRDKKYFIDQITSKLKEGNATLLYPS